jgi:diguanylate cyclase (GGDEF)-like protein
LSVFEDETYDNQFDISLEEELSKQNAVLIVLNGTDLGKRFLLNDGSTVIGRNPLKANITISDRTVSAIHSRIDYNPSKGQYFITDLRSRNGILVNSNKASTAPLTNGDKIFIGATILKFTFEDTFEDRFYTQIHELMNVDRLTGLPVKRVFDREFNSEFYLTKRRGEPLSLLMMDMDGLKGINDTYGHQMGSFSISETGKIIAAVVGNRGVASRFGGDEFIAFLHSTSLTEAEQVGESIRAGVAGHTFDLHGKIVSPTISIGVAELTKKTKTPEDLVRIADEALYRAKNAGRNTVSS